MHISFLLLLKLFALLNILSVGILLFGNIINRFFSFFASKNKWENYFYNYLLGLVALYSLIAIIKTYGLSAYTIGILCIIIYYRYRQSDSISSSGFTIFKYNKWQFLNFFLIGLIVFLISSYFNYLSYFIMSGKTSLLFDKNMYFIPNDVNYYYYNLSVDIYEKGIESVYANPTGIYPSYYIPYHFTELWINGFISKIFSVSSPISYLFLTIPLIRIAIVLGFLSVISYYSESGFKQVIFLVIGLFFSGSYFILGKHWLLDCLPPFIHLGNMWLAPKNNIIYVFLLFILNRYIVFKTISFNFLYDLILGTILLSLSYFALIPVWFIALFFIWIMILIYSILRREYKPFFRCSFLIMSFYALSLFFIYYLYPKFSEGININNPLSFKEILFYNPILKIKVFVWGIVKVLMMYLLFVFISFFYLRTLKNNLSKFIFPLIIIVLCVLIPLFSWCLFIPTFNAEQLFSLSCVPSLNIGFFTVILDFSSVKKLDIKKILLILILVSLNFAQISNNNIKNQIRNKKIKLYFDTGRFNKISRIMHPYTNKNLYLYYVYVTSPNDSILLSEGHQMVAYFFPDIAIYQPNIYTVNINEQLLNNSTVKYFTNELAARIKTNIFYMYCQKRNNTNFNELTLSFISNYKPACIITREDDSLPSFLSPIVKDTMHLNKHIFYFLSY